MERNLATAKSSMGSEDATNRLLLDIKALMLLRGSDDHVSQEIGEKIALSRDADISEFVSVILESSKKKGNGGSASAIVIAIGEMVLAAILMVAGLAILAPSVTGLSSPAQLSGYFNQIISLASTQPILSSVIPFGEFILSIVLLLGAFYNLRVAAANLKSARTEGPAYSMDTPESKAVSSPSSPAAV